MAECSFREQQLYLSGEGVGSFVCGPVGLVEDFAIPALKELGFVEGKSIFVF